MAASVLSDGLLRLDANIYPRHCVEKAIQAYKDFVDVEILAGIDGEYLLRLVVRAPYLAQEPPARKEFINYLLDFALQEHLAPR